MAKKRAKGGNVKPSDAAARVDIAEKSAFVALAVPKAPARPKAIEAPTIDDAIKGLDITFKLKLRKLDGSLSREEIRMNALEDFEEQEIVKKSPALREQQAQMLFLHDFQNELQHNPAFVEELKDILASDKKQALLQFLSHWRRQLKQPTPQFLELLHS